MLCCCVNYFIGVGGLGLLFFRLYQTSEDPAAREKYLMRACDGNDDEDGDIKILMMMDELQQRLIDVIVLMMVNDIANILSTSNAVYRRCALCC